uniref:Uncharacterized protein n=1 Tax=Anguilla anguilla TaxID=7936 RepID=A0A0E9RQE5_ANGAN
MPLVNLKTHSPALFFL